MALTERQKRFVEAYLIDPNATQAAIKAGYSEATAASQGERLLRNVEVNQTLSDARAERSEKTKIDAQWVLERLATESVADIADLYDSETGALLPVHQWPLIWRQGLIQGIDVEEMTDEGVVIGRVRKIKVSDRIKRLELIGKHIGVNAFQEVVSVKGLDSLAERMERAMKRDD